MFVYINIKIKLIFVLHIYFYLFAQKSSRTNKDDENKLHRHIFCQWHQPKQTKRLFKEKLNRSRLIELPSSFSLFTSDNCFRLYSKIIQKLILHKKSNVSDILYWHISSIFFQTIIKYIGAPLFKTLILNNQKKKKMFIPFFGKQAQKVFLTLINQQQEYIFHLNLIVFFYFFLFFCYLLYFFESH